MDFALTDAQKKLRGDIIQFAQSALNDDVLTRDREATFSSEGWQRCADIGLLGLPVPKRWSGSSDVDLVTGLVAMEALGYGCADNGLALAVSAHVWTVVLPILHFGSDDLKDRYLPGLTDGSLIGVHAITEPEAGSDVYSLRTVGTPCDGGYKLSGTKRFVTCAPVADVALVFATVDPAKGRWGITAFVVDLTSPGVERSAVRDKMGLRTAPMGDLVFDQCFVPAENRLGPEGSGYSISKDSLEYERICILANQLGAMERQLEETISYAKSRVQFGQPVGKFQSVSNRIADMKLRHELGRLLLYKTGWMKETGKSAALESSLVKLWLSESFVASALDAVRVHGGTGYLTETGVERDLRDAVGSVIYAGTSDIQRNIIARLLGL